MLASWNFRFYATTWGDIPKTLEKLIFTEGIEKLREIASYLTIDYSYLILQLMPANLKNTHAHFYPCQMHFFRLNIFSDTFTYSTGDH